MYAQQLEASRLHNPGFRRPQPRNGSSMNSIFDQLQMNPSHEKSLRERIADDIEKRCWLLTPESYLEVLNVTNELFEEPPFLARQCKEWRILNQIEESLVKCHTMQSDFRRGDSKNVIQVNNMCRTSNIIESEELSVFENEALVKKLEQYIAELESNYDFLEEMNRQLQSQFPCTLQADVSQESEIEDSSQESE